MPPPVASSTALHDVLSSSMGDELTPLPLAFERRRVTVTRDTQEQIFFTMMMKTCFLTSSYYLTSQSSPVPVLGFDIITNRSNSYPLTTA